MSDEAIIAAVDMAERLLAEPLATALLAGAVPDGGRVRVDAADGRMTVAWI